MQTHLSNVTAIIDTYHSLTINSGAELGILLKNLTSELFYLEKFRSEYHAKYNEIIYNRNGSVAAATVEAEKEVPELYMLRRVMNAAYRCVDAMRSNISYIKKEN